MVINNRLEMLYKSLRGQIQIFGILHLSPSTLKIHQFTIHAWGTGVSLLDMKLVSTNLEFNLENRLSRHGILSAIHLYQTYIIWDISQKWMYIYHQIFRYSRSLMRRIG